MQRRTDSASTERGQTEDARALRVFIAYLSELPLAAWIDAARQRGIVHNTSVAEASLRRVVRQLGAEQVLAAKDAVLEALQRFECIEGRHLTRPRSATEHLRLATENAALAVLSRPRLTTDEFRTLYAPFESVIPAELLFGLEG